MCESGFEAMDGCHMAKTNGRYRSVEVPAPSIERFVKQAMLHSGEDHHVHLDELIGTAAWAQMAEAADHVLHTAQEVLRKRRGWDFVAVVIYWCNKRISQHVGARPLPRSFYHKYTPPELVVMETVAFCEGYYPLCGVNVSTILPCGEGVRRVVYEGRCGDVHGDSDGDSVFTVALL